MEREPKLAELFQNYGVEKDVADPLSAIAKSFYKAQPRKRTFINQKTYQLFQREMELGSRISVIMEITGFARSTVFKLKNDYLNGGYYYLKYGSHHSLDEVWQRDIPCPFHLGEVGMFTPNEDINHARLNCLRCDWFRHFSRFPALDIKIDEYIKQSFVSETQHETTTWEKND
jgi:hypothetical protein